MLTKDKSYIDFLNDILYNVECVACYNEYRVHSFECDHLGYFSVCPNCGEHNDEEVEYVD